MLWLFRVLPNFHECLYNPIETRSTCFLFLLENNATRKRKTTCQLSLSKCKCSLLTSSLRQQRALVLCLHRVIQTQFLTNQCTCFLRTVLIKQTEKKHLKFKKRQCRQCPLCLYEQTFAIMFVFYWLIFVGNNLITFFFENVQL